MTVDLHSLEAEQYVLGALINHPESWKVATGIVNADDFSWNDHRRIWVAISEMVDIGAPVNPVTVTHRVGKENWKTVQGIARGALGVTDVQQYAEVIRDRAVRRRLAAVDTLTIASESSSAAEAIGKVRAHIDAITATAVETGPRMIADILHDWQQDLKERKDAGGGVRGMRCGIEPLDVRWSGLCGGQMIVIAGRPGNGKTTLAMNIAQSVARGGKSVLVFSFEMHAIELTDKLVSADSGNPLRGLKVGEIEADGWGRIVDSVTAMRGMRLAIDTGTSRSIDQIRLTCRAHALRHGLDLVIVDYLQQVSAPGAETRRNEVEQVSRGLKLMALEMGIPVIALSQMSRAVESRGDKRPVLSDLRESGSIEQDADIVSFAHRPELVGGGDCWKGIAEIITAKSRHTEPGTDLLRAELDRSRFVPYDGEYPVESRKEERKGVTRNTKTMGGF